MKNLLPLDATATAIDDRHLWLSTWLVNELEMHPVFLVLVPIEVERYEVEHFALEVHTDEHTFDVVVWVLRVPYHHLRVAIVVRGELVLSHGQLNLAACLRRMSFLRFRLLPAYCCPKYFGGVPVGRG